MVFLRGRGDDVELIEAREHIYIARARNLLTARALEAAPDVVVFLDDDVTATEEEWRRLVDAPVDFICGAYRLKQEKVDYPITFEVDELMAPLMSLGTGYIALTAAPAGFVAIKGAALAAFALAHADRAYDVTDDLGLVAETHLDLWPTGLEDRRWWGEDFGFCRLWRKDRRAIWLDPAINPVHWGFDDQGHAKPYAGEIAAWGRQFPSVRTT